MRGKVLWFSVPGFFGLQFQEKLGTFPKKMSNDLRVCVYFSTLSQNIVTPGNERKGTSSTLPPPPQSTTPDEHEAPNTTLRRTCLDLPGILPGRFNQLHTFFFLFQHQS